MGYVAWCDGSVTSNEKNTSNNVYVSFIITDHSDNVLTQYKAQINGLETSVQAEYIAFYLMLEKIKELNLKDIEIYSDCKTVVDDFTKKSLLEYSFREPIINKIGWIFYYQIITKIDWKNREFNKAHPLFKNRMIECDMIDSPIGVSKIKKTTKMEIKKIKQLKRDFEQNVSKATINIESTKVPSIPTIEFEKNEVVQNTEVHNDVKETEQSLSIPNTGYKIKEVAFKKFASSVKSNKYDTLDKVLLLLHKKIGSSMVFDVNNKKVLVAGKLQMYINNNLIEKVLMNASEWTTLWREKNRTDGNRQIKLKKIKEKPLGPAIIVPGTNILIENRLLEKVRKLTSSLSEEGMEKTIQLISERLINSIKIKQGDYDVYIIGKFHIYVAHNMVQEYKIFRSQWTELSKKIKRKQ